MSPAELLRPVLPRLAGARRVLLDGGSGAGKTTLARELAREWSALVGTGVQLVSLDDVYPGWHGLAAGSRAVAGSILRDEDAGYRRWNWERDEPADWVALDPARPLLVEGCGALTRQSAPLADLRLWLELDVATRKALALERDGEGYAPWWDAWAAQEAEHWDTNRPWELADLVLERMATRRP